MIAKGSSEETLRCQLLASPKYSRGPNGKRLEIWADAGSFRLKAPVFRVLG